MEEPVAKIVAEPGSDVRPDDLLSAESKRKGKNYTLPDPPSIGKKQKSGFFGKSKEKVSNRNFDKPKFLVQKLALKN